MNNQKGRPTKYTDEDLKEILFNYATKNVGKINYLKLEKETGIKRHVWSRRLSKEIELLNNKSLIINTEKFNDIILPNVSDIVEKNYNNKEKLISELISLNEYIENLWNKAINCDKLEDKNIDLSNKISSLKEEIKFLKDNRDYYKTQYEKIAIESTYKHKQKEKNITNILDINDKKKMTSNNWETNFPDLF